MKTSEGKINVNLIVCIVMGFALSMTATVFNGILDLIAVSMGIPIANTGLLNSAYAYGGAIGVPITLILFRKIERTKMLKATLLLTIAMNLALTYSQNFNPLLVLRFITGINYCSINYRKCRKELSKMLSWFRVRTTNSIKSSSWIRSQVLNPEDEKRLFIVCS